MRENRAERSRLQTRRYRFSERLPRLEIRHMLWRQGDRSPVPGIASKATRAEVERERAEAANLNPATGSQARGYVLKHCVDRQLNISTSVLR